MSPRSELTTAPKKIQLNKITSKEREVVIAYALSHTEINHREMAYRMIDENVAFMSPSSVYRLLREINLISTRQKGVTDVKKWNPHDDVDTADQKWQTDLTFFTYEGRDYYLLSYLDVYSRYVVYHKLCLSMTGDTIRDITKEAFQVTGITPAIIQSDNGSCYISHEYHNFVTGLDIDHRFIHPHCPNENAEIERYHRTLKEAVDPEQAQNFIHLVTLINEQIYYYNHIRYHSKIGFIPPYEKYRGNPDKIFEERKRKLENAKIKRMKINYQQIITQD
jgi:putative transposase